MEVGTEVKIETWLMCNIGGNGTWIISPRNSGRPNIYSGEGVRRSFKKFCGGDRGNMT
jgi:hypothetical protein